MPLGRALRSERDVVDAMRTLNRQGATWVVVAGDVLVGACVFGVLTIVQYLVIASGAERVLAPGGAEALHEHGLAGLQEDDLDADPPGPQPAQHVRVTLDDRGERIELRGFGVFQVKPRKRGIGRNPRTGKEVRIPPGRTIRFKPGKDLKNL